MWREIARFEVALQRREFLTAIYAVVFFFLTFGYTSSSVVELVTGRGAVARNAPWALAHAMAGVTAFGQIITTMITASAVMRDVATRQQELLFATQLTRRDYLAGRWLGAVMVMLAVYAAIPLGLFLGTLMPWVEPATLQPFDPSAYARPLLLLVLPNILFVSALFFSAGALRRSFMAILLLGVALVAMWSTGVALVREGVVWGALLDPFGNAALELSTRGWDAAMRNARPIPLGGWLLANRVAWLSVGGAVLAWLSRAYRFEVVGTDAPLGRRGSPLAQPANGARSRVPAGAAPASPPHAVMTSRATSRWQALRAEAGWTLQWTLRERGFVTLAALGALNALANAWRVGSPSPTAGNVLSAVQDHSRIFLILVATIYAGELVWRERDVRADAMRDVLPIDTGTLVAGRIAGLLGAQIVLAVPLLAVALLVGFGRGATGMSVGLAVAWIYGLVVPFLMQLTLLSLLVHAVLQHKVAGHMVLITGWVLAVAMERSLALAPWLRFGNLPPHYWTTADGFGGDGASMAWWVVYWSAVALACGVLAASWWVRGVMPATSERVRRSFRQLQGAPTALLLMSVALAAVALAAGATGDHQ